MSLISISTVSGNTVSFKVPRSCSGRILLSVWGLTCIIVLSGYTANLTSSLADRTSVADISSLYDRQVTRTHLHWSVLSTVSSYWLTVSLPVTGSQGFCYQRRCCWILDQDDKSGAVSIYDRASRYNNCEAGFVCSQVLLEVEKELPQIYL